jgi:phospholipid/cholesterol/gamma-HCH transport system substrate-binding protein
MLRPKPGETYPVIKSQPSFYSQLANAFSRLTAEEKLPTLLDNLNGLIQDARAVVDRQSQAEIRRILADLAKITQAVATHRAELADSIAKANVALDRFAAVGKTLDERLPEVLEQTSSTMRALRDTTREVSRTSASLNAALDGSRADILQFTGQTLPESGLLVAELRRLTATLQRFAGDLEREPSALIFGRAAPARGPGE